MFVCRGVNLTTFSSRNTNNSNVKQYRSYAKESSKGGESKQAKPATRPPSAPSQPPKKSYQPEPISPIRAKIEAELEHLRATSPPTFNPEKIKSADKHKDAVYKSILSAPITPSASSEALYQVAEEKKRVQEITDEVLRILVILTDKKDALGFRLSGFGNVVELNQSFVAEMKRAFNMSNELFDFLAGLIGVHQFPNTVDILKGFIKIVSEERGEVYGSLTTAEPLTPEQYAWAAKQFQLFLKPKEKLFLDKIVDPAIEGGYIAELPSAVIDASDQRQWQTFVNSYLDQLKQSFSESQTEPSPKQKKIDAELEEVFGKDNIPEIFKTL